VKESQLVDFGTMGGLAALIAMFVLAEITVAGSVTFTEEAAALDFELSVVGGTGRWDDVGGELTVVEEQGTTRLVFCLNHLD
jgi:hypothetical protein